MVTTTLKEFLDKEYPTKKEKNQATCISYYGNFGENRLTNRGNEDLSDFVNLKTISLAGGSLVSVDFLNTLPNPWKLEELLISSNNIQPTDISVFSKFTNLRILQLGNTSRAMELAEGHNHFYGSFESWKDLSKLQTICIEATDVNEGLEYLPISFARLIAEYTRGDWSQARSYIQCSPHGTDAKCSVIQDELRNFDYDLEAWQLAHPEKMLLARPELFTNPESKDRWIEALDKKIGKSERELLMTRTAEIERIKKIARLESQLAELRGTKNHLEKSTQTDLTGEDIKKALETQKQIQLST